MGNTVVVNRKNTQFYVLIVISSDNKRSSAIRLFRLIGSRSVNEPPKYGKRSVALGLVFFFSSAERIEKFIGIMGLN